MLGRWMREVTVALQHASMGEEGIIDNEHGWILGQFPCHRATGCVHTMPGLFLFVCIQKIIAAQTSCQS